MSTLVPGRVYYGPGEQRLLLLRIEGSKAICEWPISHRPETMTVAQLEKWAKGSDRRTYHHRKGEVRTKRETDPETGAVTYHTPGFAEVKTVSKAAWERWRKGVPSDA